MFAQNPELVIALWLIWLGCGLLTAGLYNAKFQRKWPSLRSGSDLFTGLFYGMFGPIGLLATITTCLTLDGGFPYGWSLKIDAVKGWHGKH